jgi:hypothetical protein
MKVFTCVYFELFSGYVCRPGSEAGEPGISDLSDVVAMLRIIILHALLRAARLSFRKKKPGRFYPARLINFSAPGIRAVIN